MLTGSKSTSLSVARQVALAVSFPLLCALAHGQTIQKCRIDGRLVFQSSPCPLEAQHTVTPPAAAEATASNAGVPKKKTLADVLRERDGADRRPAMREAQSDGANVLRSRMGAV